MKILMVTTAMGIGGAETHICELCLAFAERGISVSVASAGGVYASVLEQHGITHITLPLNRKTPTALFTAKKGLEAYIRRERFDIVHAHARLPALLCAQLHRRYGFRFVTTDHLDFRLTPLLKKLTEWGEFTFAVSEDLRGYLLRNFRLDPERIALTVNGIDTDRFSPDTKAAPFRECFPIGNRAVILHVSRLEKHLSLCAHALMGAVEALDGRAVLVIVGDGSYAQELQNEAAALNRKLGYQAVTPIGAITEVEHAIAAADIVVSPSRAAMEAMACAKPTVVCGSQGYGGIFSEAIADQAITSNFCFRGSLLPTPELLANDIQTILDMNEDQKKALGNFARRFICENYSVDIMAQTQLDGYEKLLDKTNGYDILICGYYGYGNMGDESLLSVITDECKRQHPALKICALSANPEQTKSDHGIDAVARFDPERIAQVMERSKMLLFGGGNLLQDKTSTHSLLYYTHILRMAKKRGMRILIYANGIGPLFREKNRERTATALRLADAISLRDPHSFEFVKSICPASPVRLTFDPAVLTEQKEFPVPCEHYFVVVPKKSSPASTDTLVRLIRTLAQATGMSPFLISMYDKQDMAFVKTIASRTDASVCRPQNAGECIGLLAKAKLVISSRLHGLVYATAAACPMMGYSDDEKLFSYLDHIGFGTNDVLPCGISVNASADAVIGRAMEILRQSEACRAALSRSLQERKALAKQEIREAILLLENNRRK